MEAYAFYYLLIASSGTLPGGTRAAWNAFLLSLDCFPADAVRMALDELEKAFYYLLIASGGLEYRLVSDQGGGVSFYYLLIASAHVSLREKKE